MKKTKLAILILISCFMIGALASIQLPKVKAFSAPSTGVGPYGVDTTYGTSAYISGYSIFALDNQINFYDQYGQLTKTFTGYQTFTLDASWSVNNMGAAPANPLVPDNGLRTAIYAVNSTHLLIATSEWGYGIYTYVATGKLFLNIGLLNVNSLSYTSLLSTNYAYGGTNGGSGQNYYGCVGNSITIMPKTNATGIFYWVLFSGEEVHSTYASGAATTYGIGSYLDYVGYTAPNSVFTASVANKVNVDGTNYMFTSPYAFFSTPDNCFYILSCNGWQGSNQAQITSYNLVTTCSIVGSTGVANSYTGNCITATSNPYASMAYIIGNYYYAAQDTNEINVAFSFYTGYQFGIDTISFNASSIAVSNIVTWGGLNTNTYVARPFVVSTPSGGGNVSGLYSTAIWHNVWTTMGLTGFSETLSGIETGSPAWMGSSLPNILYQWTPQQPQIFNWTASTNAQGYQLSNQQVGIEIDAWNTRCVGQLFYSTNAVYTWNGMLTGDIFNNAVLSQSPTEVSLKQAYSNYTFIGNLYQAGILQANGTYNLLSTGLCQTSTVALQASYSQVATGSMIKGAFTFAFASRTAAAPTVWEGYRVNILLADGTNLTYTYLFGWYQPGGPNGSGLVPYPTPAPGSTIAPIVSGGVINSDALSASMLTIINFLVLFLLIGAPAVLLGVKMGLPGFIGGAVIGLGIGVIAGLVPFWFIFLAGTGVVASFLMWQRNKAAGQ